MDHKRLAVLHALASKRIVLRLFFGLAALLLFAGHAAAQTGTWALDPAHTIVRFKIRHLMISYVDAGFNKVSGTIQYDPKDLSKTSIQATIDATSEQSNSDARDKDVKANYLEVDKYPTMTFQSKRAEAAGNGNMKVTGDLTIHGVTKEAVLDVTEISGPVKNAQGATHMGAVATTKISRKDFGITKNAIMEGGGLEIGDDVMITINIDMTQGGGRGRGARGETPAQQPTN